MIQWLEWQILWSVTYYFQGICADKTVMVNWALIINLFQYFQGKWAGQHYEWRKEGGRRRGGCVFPHVLFGVCMSLVSDHFTTDRRIAVLWSLSTFTFVCQRVKLLPSHWDYSLLHVLCTQVFVLCIAFINSDTCYFHHYFRNSFVLMFN